MKESKKWKPNQSGTFSNRTAIHNAETEEKLFVIEFTELPTNKECADIIRLINAAPDLFKSLTELLEQFKRVVPLGKYTLDNILIKEAELVLSKAQEK